MGQLKNQIISPAIILAIVVTLASISVYTRTQPASLEQHDGREGLAFGSQVEFNNTLKTKNAKERTSMKSDEIVRTVLPGIFTDSENGFTITIESIEKIEDGVSIYASASRGGKPVGFLDGTVEVEHFIFINPPVMVDDASGPITIDSMDAEGNIAPRKLRVDGQAAIISALAHTMSRVAKDDSKLVRGKRGNTTTTVYAGAAGTADELLRRGTNVNESWGTIRAGAGNNNIDANCGPNVLADTTSNQWDVLDRCGYTFDTSSIPDTDAIDSATISFYGVSLTNGVTGMSTNVVSFSPASDSNFVNADYNTFGTTKFATDKAVSGWGVESYNDFALNSSGLANISKTGISKFGHVFKEDADNTAPTWVSGAQTLPNAYDSTNAGTTKDPKLVVVHSATAAEIPVVQISNATVQISNSTLIVR